MPYAVELMPDVNCVDFDRSIPEINGDMFIGYADIRNKYSLCLESLRLESIRIKDNNLRSIKYLESELK